MQTLETYEKWKKDPLRYQEEILADLEHPIYIPEGATREVMEHYLRLVVAQCQAGTALNDANNKIIQANNKILEEELALRKLRQHMFKPGEA